MYIRIKKKNHYERDTMKKLLLLLLIGVSAAYAQNEKMRIYQNSSGNPAEISLISIKDITFEEGNMNITNADGEVSPYSISSIDKINFLPATLNLEIYFHMHSGEIITYNVKDFDEIIFVTEITSVKDNGESYPGEVSITKGAPNPFTDNTEIEFLLEKPGYVEASITDVNGNTIAGLLKGDLDKGSHSVAWDGNNIDGQRVSPGAYICSVRLNNIVVSKKLIFVN